VEQYVIRGGREGYERLPLLARDRWPDTAALFERVGLSPGMRCIDLGYGGDEVTLEIARLVGPDDSVTGADMDEVKLDLAREAAVGSVWTEGEGKTLAWSTLDATAEAIVSEGIAARDEVAAALDDLERFTEDPGTLISGPRVFQAWSRRGGGPT
jgi:ubiquinone/menaquinone biosynthesis C-methylase UbiE